MPLKINPYLTLGITKDQAQNSSKTKNAFREKLSSARNNDELRAKICLAYDIIVNKKFYKECEKDVFKINDELGIDIICGYYYAIIGDCYNLISIIEKNINIIYFKDPLERNLLYLAARNGHASICEYLINKGIKVNEIQKTGSTPLHGAAYYGQTNVVKLLLSYGAKTNIKNNFGHLPIDEAMTEEIKNLIKESEKDPIFKLYQSLLSKNIAQKLVPISQQGDVIAKKIICKLINLPKHYNSEEVENNWEIAWHGTNYNVLESIAEIGLKPAGGKNKNGEEIQVCYNHMSQTSTVGEVKNWGRGIFVSPSIFYSGYEAYAKEICCKNEQWKVLVEVRVKPNSYYEHKSTCSNYHLKNGEPELLEYRIPAKNEKDVQVFSLTFVKNTFFENAKNYEEGELLKKNYF
jgi:ankyrin repeat protein